MLRLTWQDWLVLAAAVVIPHAGFLLILKWSVARAPRCPGTESEEAFWARLKDNLQPHFVLWVLLLGFMSALALVINFSAGSAQVKLGPMPPFTIACGVFACAFPGQLVAAAIAFRQAGRTRRLPSMRVLGGVGAILFAYPWLIVFPALWFGHFTEAATDRYGPLYAKWGDGGRAVLVLLAYCAILLWLAVSQAWLVASPIQWCLRKPKTGARPQAAANGPPQGPSGEDPA